MLILTAAAMAFFATTVLAALTGYVTSVTGEGLRRTVAGASFTNAGVRIQATADDLASADREVRTTVGHAFGKIPASVSMSARSGSYALPGQEHTQHPQLTVFGVITGVEAHARLATGRWPRDTPTGVAEAALSEPAARMMKTPAGSVVTLHSRVGGAPVTVRITGTFRVTRADDYIWGGDPLVTQGVQRLGFETFGPLLVSAATFEPRFGKGVVADWRALPDLRPIRSGDLHELAARVRTLAPTLSKASGSDDTVATALPDLLDQLDRALLVSRSTMLIPAVQLMVLAAYALMLVARLLAEHRRLEVALMRARGAAGRQIAVAAIAEGLLIALPGAVVAPFAAPVLLRLVSATAAVHATGVHLETSPSALTWIVAIAVALACAVALALPTLNGATRSYAATVTARGRGERRGAIQRSGLGLALFALAAVSVWQLAHYGGPVTSAAGSAQGLAVDPVIVAGPALALLAGGVMILRLVPVASRIAERATARTSGFAPAIGTRQVSRRPLRYAGSALLLVMAIAVGILSLSTGITWRHSQIAQADFQSGPDLRIKPSSDVISPTAAGQGGRYAALPGVTALSPVFHNTVTAGNQDVTLLAADTPQAGDMLGIRGAGTALARLAAGRPGTPPALVPGRPGRMTFRMRLSRHAGPLTAGVSAVISDGADVTHLLPLGDVAGDGRARTLTADVAALAGPAGIITYPIAIRGFSLVYNASLLGTQAAELTVEQVRGGSGADLGAPLPAPRETAWQDSVTPQDPNLPTPIFLPGGYMTLQLPALSRLPSFSIYSVSVTALLGESSDALPPLPGIITSDLASTAHVSAGGRLTVNTGPSDQQIVVAGVVPALPTTEADRPGILVDWASLNERELADGQPPRPPDEWWLTVRGATAPAARVLSAHPTWDTSFIDRHALRDELLNAPLGAGLQGALVLGFAAALVFALIGFAVNAMVSARERLAEFAIMRALGVSSRQVFGLVMIEQAFLAGLALAGGTLVGILVAHLVVPHIVLTVRATAPYPPVDLLTPWRQIAMVLAGVLLALLLVIGGLVRAMRRQGIGRAARLGEDG
jgi:hypothetical protein